MFGASEIFGAAIAVISVAAAIGKAVEKIGELID